MDTIQQLQQLLSSQNSGLNDQTNPFLLPRMQVMQISGEQGARNAAIGPDSTCLAIDTAYKDGLLVWFIQTDSAGNKVTVADYDLIPHVHKEPPDFNKLQSIMESMASQMDDLTKRVSTMEDALK